MYLRLSGFQLKFDQYKKNILIFLEIQNSILNPQECRLCTIK